MPKQTLPYVNIDYDYTNTTATSITLNSPYTARDVWSSTGTNGISIGDFKPSGKIVLKGDDADIDINGTSLKDFMAKMEQRLAMLKPNPELESEWEELRALGDQYRQLEQHIKDKMKTWDILNKE
jgi:hypothetical protein